MIHVDELLNQFPTDRPIIFFDHRQNRLIVRIYPGLEKKTADRLRYSLKIKSFRRDDHVAHRNGKIITTEQWHFTLRAPYDGIKACIPAICEVHGVRYVTSDPNDHFLRRVDRSLLKLADHQYQSYIAKRLL